VVTVNVASATASGMRKNRVRRHACFVAMPRNKKNDSRQFTPSSNTPYWTSRTTFNGIPRIMTLWSTASPNGNASAQQPTITVNAHSGRFFRRLP